MKKSILILSIFIGATASAQNLKDALFGGKLKTDSNTVLRKGEDLTNKIDTARKKPVEPEKPKPVIANVDASGNKMTSTPDSTTVAPVKTDVAAALKDNNKIWKEFVDSIVSTLNAEVMNAKQIKKGDYFVIVDYSIETDGTVTIKNVMPTPENKFLTDQIRERLSIDTPKLNPVLGGDGKPRKSSKRYNFTVTSK